ncbi:MAG: hypothetical protein IT424_08790 [Pirellulales bacterium]|nr:hypothetical protein [Pirellulales bacterium]
MLQELRWRVSVSATCLHAARCRSAGLSAADPQLAEGLAEPADRLVGEIAAAQWPVAAVLEQLSALAADIDNNRDLVARAAAALGLPPGPPAAHVRIAGAISDLEAASTRLYPDRAEELGLRIGPLREQWEARGPGMLYEIGRLTDEAVIPTSAEIVVVAPYVGGHGVAHVRSNRVTLEGVLYSPRPELPEPVRIAWLLAQLNADLPRFCEAAPAGRIAGIFPLAMLLPALAAAEAVEFGPCSETAAARALAAWHICAESAAAGVATRLWTWWNAWLDHSKSWPVACAALDRLLA